MEDFIKPYCTFNGEGIGDKEEISIVLESGFTISGPDVRPKKPSKITFTKETRLAYTVLGPIMDFQMQQNIARKFSLRDLDGNLQSDHSVLGLKLSEGNDIVQGKFYLEFPTKNIFYCHEINGDLTTWFCVESYQHGLLLQSKLKQKIEHASSYIRIRDSKEIIRCQANF